MMKTLTWLAVFGIVSLFAHDVGAQITGVTSGTLTQEVNTKASTSYQGASDVLFAEKEWKFNAGSTGGTVTIVTSWTPGGNGTTTSTFPIPANANNWSVLVSSSYTVGSPPPGAVTCNFSMTYTGNSVSTTTPAGFLKAIEGGGPE